MDILALCLHHCAGLRWFEKYRLAEHYNSSELLLQTNEASVGELVGRKLRCGIWQPEKALDSAMKDAAIMRERGWRQRSLLDVDYPHLLRHIHDPPWLLYCMGEPPLKDELWIAVVGTRMPSESARQAARGFGLSCARRGVGLVSGLAYGIDGAAHAGCLEAGGRTLAILPGGLDCITPAGNRRLAQSIVQSGGCLATEAPPGTVPVAWRFVCRNRIIAGITPATMVVEAPQRSGALISAQYALEEGRDVFVHPVGCNQLRGQGTLALCEQGATVCSSAEELLARYGRTSSSV